MSKLYGWIKEPVKVVLLSGIVFFIAVAVKTVYFPVPWWQFW